MATQGFLSDVYGTPKRQAREAWGQGGLKLDSIILTSVKHIVKHIFTRCGMEWRFIAGFGVLRSP